MESRPSDERKAAAQQPRLPTIDFRGLEAGQPRWAEARAEVMAALEAYGGFDAVYDGVGPDLRAALFGRAVPELFESPLEAKRRNAAILPYLGYVGGIPGMAYESLRISDAPDLHSVEEFARLLWPDGNPAFCDTVWRYAKQLQQLEQTVEKMVQESLGLEKHYTSHLGSLDYGLLLSEYGVPSDQDTKIGLQAHRDPNIITIVCQHQVEGLEMQTKDGEWVPVPTSPDTFTVMTGEAFQVFTNGRVQAPVHRVKAPGDRKRYSALLGSKPSEGCVVQTPEELVDEEHPLAYEPCNYSEYLKFRFAPGQQAEDTLRAFCGVERAGIDEALVKN